jgi:hypothetical protein
MKNLFKRFAALALSLAFVAPAFANGTFGSSQFLQFDAFSNASSWPTAVDPPGPTSVCLRSTPGTPNGNCVSTSSSNGADHFYVQKGWKIRGIYCMKQKGFDAAGDDFELEIGLFIAATGQTGTMSATKITPVVRLTNTIVTAAHGSTELFWMDFEQQVNYTVPYDGFIGFTFFKADLGGNTNARFDWRCTATIEAGS